MRRHVMLVGLPGVGKSTVGRLVSEGLPAPLIDIDLLLVRQVGRPVDQIFGMMGEPVELSVVEQPAQGSGGRMEAYERLLGDAMAGDATLFARQDVVEAAWAIVDPVIHGPSPMFEYEPGTWGPVQGDALVADVGGWITPE